MYWEAKRQAGYAEIGSKTMQLDHDTELFVDDLLIDMKRGVKRILHPGVKLDKPVLTPDYPWEQGGSNKCRRLKLRTEMCRIINHKS